MLDAWAHQQGVQLQFSRQGKPVDHTFIEVSTVGCGTSASTSTASPSIADAQQMIERWRIGYNTARPRGGFAGRTPSQLGTSFMLENTPTRLSA